MVILSGFEGISLMTIVVLNAISAIYMFWDDITNKSIKSNNKRFIGTLLVLSFINISWYTIPYGMV